MRNWADLPNEMVCMICNRVSFFKDLVAFGGVCSTWRRMALEENLGQPLLPFPWLMLAENQHDDLREFYSVTEGKTYKFELPELRGKKCMETKGWIVTASTKGEMALVHPLTSHHIPLPHQNTSKCYYEHPMRPLIFVHRAVLSSPPDPKNERDCVLMILHGGMRQIGLCRPGDKVWTIVMNNFECGIHSVEYYRGKFYVLNEFGEVWEYDVIGKSNDIIPVTSRRIEVNIKEHMLCKQSYLVASAGSLLVVIRDGIYHYDYTTTICSVLDIDVELGVYNELRSLGTRAIFLGHSASLSVETILYPELISNSIYFTDDCCGLYRDDPDGGGSNMGVYRLEDGSARPHYRGKSLSSICPPIWTFITSR